MLYRYEALDVGGKAAGGTTEAGSPADARSLLRERGLVAWRVEEARVESRRGGVSWLNLSGRRLELLSKATKHLSLLLGTGLPLAQSLAILAKEVQDRPFRETLEEIASRVREGKPFDQALASHPRYFPELFVHVVRAGTEAGELPKVLVDLGAHYLRQKKIRDRVVSALTYPALMSLVGIVVLVFLMAFVVPRVTAVLLEEKRALPWPTEVLLFASNLFSGHWPVAVTALVLTVLGGAKLCRTGLGRRLAERLALAVPILGELYRKQAVARWAGTMATLLGSGIPVAQALGVVRGAVGSALLAEDVARLEKEVLEGAKLSESLKRSRILPPTLGFVAGVGEEAGELDRILREVAESLNDEVEVTSGRVTELINPVMVVVLGLLVGFIVAAILLPITDFSRIQ